MTTPVMRTLAAVSLIAAAGVLSACGAATSTADTADTSKPAEATAEETTAPESSTDDAIATYFSYDSMSGAELADALAATMADVDSYTCQVGTTYRGPATNDQSTRFEFTGLSGDAGDVTVLVKGTILTQRDPDDPSRDVNLTQDVITVDGLTYRSFDGGDSFGTGKADDTADYLTGLFALDGSNVVDTNWERQDNGDGTVTYSSTGTSWASFYMPNVTFNERNQTASDVEGAVTVDEHGYIRQLDYTAVMTQNEFGESGDAAVKTTCSNYGDVSPATAPENITE